jgi:hypothetical protein
MATKNQRRVLEGRRRSFFRRPAVLAALALAALTLLVVIGSPHDGSRRSQTSATDERRTPSRSDVAPPPLPRLILKETPPWKSTPKNTPAATPGLTPAWMVRPPPPPTLAPPRPVEPPNPIAHRPENPGGFNGDRPPRPTPGVDSPETLAP